VLTALARGKVTLFKALGHPHKAPKEVRRIFDTIESRPERIELNLYVSGIEDEPLRAARTDEPTPIHLPPLEEDAE
jgi:succinate dehydrogenase / fumarate reductase iron-sulfur subunit